MADLRRAEKLASAKKRLKQFQQKHRDGQSDSGRSTPTRKKLEEEDYVGKLVQSENGGSTYSLSHSENLSSNISGTDSPVPNQDCVDNTNGIDVHPFNGSAQPDIVNFSALNSLPKASETLFQNSSLSPSLFNQTLPQSNSHSAADFFDNLSSGSCHLDPTVHSDSVPNASQARNQMLNLTSHNYHEVNASTPDGPMFQDTPNYSFPDSSVISPILTNNSSGVVYPAVTSNKSSTTSDVNNVSENVNITNNNVINESETKIKVLSAKNEELEQQLSEQKTQIIQLQSHLEEMKKRADEGAATLKHHVQAIEILVSEKNELQNNLERRQEEAQSKAGEVEELQGRLRASRHRVSDLERDLASTKSQVTALDSSVRELTSQHSVFAEQTASQRKRIGDLEHEVSDLQSKLESREQVLTSLRAELDQKTSQLSLAEVRIQQLSGGPVNDKLVEEELSRKNQELLNTVSVLENQLSTTKAANEESGREYQHYINQQHSELQKLKIEFEAASERCTQLREREDHLVQRVSELERQLSRAPTEDPTVTTLRDQLRQAEQTAHELQAQLRQKADEVDVLRDGLEERALRIQQLELTVDRLEAERPNSANLQAAIESDKVAASRAVAQNNTLKKQLKELQEVVVKLSNNKVELTQQLQNEQHHCRELTERLQTLQVSKGVEVEKGQQTDLRAVQEAEAQTFQSQPAVSPEVMEKLEEKFRKKMSELADLSDEKQRLEHLVQQLQSETETIGEYVTLYQIQRGMLRQRAQEKDEQLAALARDKEALRNQLTHLNCLVQRLVGEKHNSEPEMSILTDATEASEPSAIPMPKETNQETAEQIRSLLTEIGSNNLVTSRSENTNINFHPCPLCSGRLITV